MNFGSVYNDLIVLLEKNLPESYLYHSVHHTIDVIRAAKHLADSEALDAGDRAILLTAALFHDAGMIYTYDDHETASAEMAKMMLPDYGYSASEADAVCEAILGKENGSKNCAASLLYDADLDYLGRDDFMIISQRLRYEWEISDYRHFDNKSWYELQRDFLKNHSYRSATAAKLRNAQKAENLLLIETILKQKS